MPNDLAVLSVNLEAKEVPSPIPSGKERSPTASERVQDSAILRDHADELSHQFQRFRARMLPPVATFRRRREYVPCRAVVLLGQSPSIECMEAIGEIIGNHVR